MALRKVKISRNSYKVVRTSSSKQRAVPKGGRVKRR